MRTMIEPATAKYEAVVRRVCCMSDRGRAIVMYPENSPESCSYTGTTRARHPRPTFDEETVIGSVWNEEMGPRGVDEVGKVGLARHFEGVLGVEVAVGPVGVADVNVVEGGDAALAVGGEGGCGGGDLQCVGGCDELVVDLGGEVALQ